VKVEIDVLVGMDAAMDVAMNAEINVATDAEMNVAISAVIGKTMLDWTRRA